MKFVPVQKLEKDPLRILDELDREGVVVTRDGKPEAGVKRPPLFCAHRILEESGCIVQPCVI
jgi:hypothetical protein